MFASLLLAASHLTPMIRPTTTTSAVPSTCRHGRFFVGHRKFSSRCLKGLRRCAKSIPAKFQPDGESAGSSPGGSPQISSPAPKPAGLQGVVFGDSQISMVDAEGGTGLQYRGYAAATLASEARYEEVAYLLIHGQLPTVEELQGFSERLSEYYELREEVREVVRNLPKNANPMHVLRTGVSLEGVYMYGKSNSKLGRDANLQVQKNRAIAERMIALFPSILSTWYKAHYSEELPELSGDFGEFSAQFSVARKIVLSFGIQEPHAESILNKLLVLYAEHDLNASAFAARVTASTKADMYGSITTALSTLGGPLHGGALGNTLELLLSFASPDQAEEFIRSAIQRKEVIPGFGHRVYRRTGDPRSAMIFTWVKDMISRGDEKVGSRPRLLAIAERIEKVMFTEKGLRPNVDFYAALLLHFLNIPPPLFVTIFAMGRVAGWSAHTIEQQTANKIIRPVSNYIGPLNLPFTPLESRSST